MSNILLSPPHLNGSEQTVVAEAFASNWICLLGPKVDQFETAVARYIGAAHSIALNSGTAAIHMGLKALDVGPGDLVFCSDVTFSASCNPVLYEKATPVFIDSDRDSWNMCPVALEKALGHYAARGRLPKAVVVVDLYGLPAKYDQLHALCRQYEVPILEDAAEALGSTYRGKRCGALGDVGVLSFNANKLITCSGGGMVLADEKAVIDKIKFWSNQSKEPVPHYLHKEVGYNYRMSNILASIGLGQMASVDEYVGKRRSINRYYRETLADLPLSFAEEVEGAYSNFWLSVALLEPGGGPKPADLISALSAKGIEARNFWNPMHRQPVFADCDFFSAEQGASVGAELFETGVCLPSGTAMDSGDLARIASVVRELYE